MAQKRTVIGHGVAFLVGAGVLYGVLLAGSPWPPVCAFGQAAPAYERTSVQVGPLENGDLALRVQLVNGWEVESTSTQSLRSGFTMTTYVLRRRVG